ncbi:bleomycin hydrolase [Salpingoeca rosetta]|uniref:bleomycin hydrolase n=1 Tax=Salpingoeca rosetta (strain ATCC 50818 / BSB-021) TaxID=946362 RepID=F2URJ7_SALR5|nr:bleomycin hydrolase [Salpingoeca rosetta]EGD80166.1 bleomycin hydrolase [Salpingoeca rosetta]|eukprot:XP_004988228.1 bleomycin hydrolase [Salpingoeca rosetta]
MAGLEITTELVDKARAEFDAEPRFKLSQNAVTRNDVKEVLPRHNITTTYEDKSFSTKLKEMKATNQKSSGRCWLFAAANCMRLAMKEKYNLPDDFELSQSYLFFWDKLERANYFTNAILETLDEDLDGRLVQHLLSDPLGDGGQWDMAVNIVLKYGIVPKSQYPESFSSCNTRHMNAFLTAKLRDFACDLRATARELSKEELAKKRDAFLAMVYRVLAIHLGTPPTTFDWCYTDTDKKFHRISNLTPLQFYREYVPFKVEDYQSLIHDPRNAVERVYTVKYLGNVLGGDRELVKHINVPIDLIRSLCKKQLDQGMPVWFGVDVGKEYHRKMAVMDTRLFDYDLVFGTRPALSKADRLRYGQSLMTHAMVFTGYNEADGKIDKWRVENSWGKDVGDSGYYLMTDEWFDEYLYQIVAPKAMVEEMVKVDMKDVVELPPWDPMGALAC